MRRAREACLCVSLSLAVVVTAGCGSVVPPASPAFSLPAHTEPVAELEKGCFAERVTTENASRLLVGGPHAIGGIGDWAIGNGVICAIVSAPEHESILSEAGGLLVDLGHCGREDDQLAVLQLGMLNLSRRNIVPISTVDAEVDEKGSRLVTRGERDGIAVETTYSLDVYDPKLFRVTSRFTRTGKGERIFMVGDSVLHGRRSLAPFVISTRHPWLSAGFRHPHSDPDRLPSVIAAIHPADLHVLVGTEDDGPGISYGLLAESAALIDSNEKSRDVQFLALNGEHFTLQAVFARPLWFGGREGIGWVQFGQTPFMNLRKGETLEVRRALVVADSADVAGVTDRFFSGAPRIEGTVDDTAARIAVRRRGNTPGTSSAFTFVRPDPDGRFVFHAPRGRYMLEVRAPGARVSSLNVDVRNTDVNVGVLPCGDVGRVRLPRDATMRLIFLGEEGTPDPRFRDDLLGFRVGREQFFNSAASREVNLAGVDADPTELILAPGRYRVLATRGPEFEIAETRLDVSAGETVDLEIAEPQRAFDTPGWITADLHVHSGRSFDSTLPLEQRVRAFAAQAGEVLVSTEHDFVADYAPVIRSLGLDQRLASLVGTEVTGTSFSEDAPFSIGHSNVFPVKVEPLAYRQGALSGEGRGIRDVVVQARERGPDTLVQLNHPRSPDHHDGEIDSASYFTHLGTAGTGFRPDLPLEEEPNACLVLEDPDVNVRDIDFDMVELMNGMSRVHYRRARADWLSLLLQGEVRTATANSDSHDAPTPVAMPRNYVRVNDDRASELDHGEFLDALRAGNVVGTSGPWIDVSMEGAGPGDTWTGRGGVLEVDVRAAAWVPVSELRVRVNGRLVHQEPSRAGAQHRVPLNFARDAFVTVEVEGEANDTYAAIAPGGVPLAFSNPIFIDADGDAVWQPPGLVSPLPPALIEPDATP